MTEPIGTRIKVYHNNNGGWNYTNETSQMGISLPRLSHCTEIRDVVLVLAQSYYRLSQISGDGKTFLEFEKRRVEDLFTSLLVNVPHGIPFLMEACGDRKYIRVYTGDDIGVTSAFFPSYPNLAKFNDIGTEVPIVRLDKGCVMWMDKTTRCLIL